MFSEFSSFHVFGRFVGLLLAGCFLAALLTVASASPERASAMEIDCSTIGGPGALAGYVESYGVRCSGGGASGGGGSAGGGGGSGCTPNTDKVPEGFFEAFNKGVENIEVVTRVSGGTSTTFLKVYRVDVNGKQYLGGEIRVWYGPGRSGISFYSYLFSRGGTGSFYQEVYYDSKMPCANGYQYDLSESLVGTSPAKPTPLVAPGAAALSDGSVMARGALTQVPSTADYLLRVDVTNNNPATPSPVAVSLIMNEFDVESVLAASGGVDCPTPDRGLQKCSVDEMAPNSTRSMTLLLRAHNDAPVDADIPIILSYQTATAATARWFYSATRPGAVVIDPVPTPPFCPPNPDSHPVVAGLLSRLITTCYDGLPMTVVAGHGTASISDYGVLSYTSDPSYRGTDTLTVTASNAHGRVSEPTTIDVTVADPPHAEADSFTVRYETPLTSTDSVLGNDSICGSPAFPVPESWYAQQGTTSPAHGSVILNRDGTFVYTPDKGFSGTDNFLYRVEGPESAASNAVKVILTVVIP